MKNIQFLLLGLVCGTYALPQNAKALASLHSEQVPMDSAKVKRSPSPQFFGRDPSYEAGLKEGIAEEAFREGEIQGIREEQFRDQRRHGGGGLNYDSGASAAYEAGVREGIREEAFREGEEEGIREERHHHHHHHHRPQFDRPEFGEDKY